MPINKFSTEENVDLEQFGDVMAVASLLKLFLVSIQNRLILNTILFKSELRC